MTRSRGVKGIFQYLVRGSSAECALFVFGSLVSLGVDENKLSDGSLNIS